MPNKHTFLIKPIKKLLSNYNFNNWVDPFAGYNSPAKITNDLNPDCPTKYHEDSLKFIEKLETNTYDGVLHDPPYSLRQLKECYDNVNLKLPYSHTLNFGDLCKDHIARITKPNGIVISFGWNSNGIGDSRGFKKYKIILIAHGGYHNDTIITIERKINGVLF
jgi:hypothetical protein